MRFILTISFLLQFAYGLDKATIADLKKYSGTTTHVFVTDWIDGGDFYRVSATMPVDGGVVIEGYAGRKWKRHYNLALGVWPQWWGARPDDSKDDLPAFRSAINYITQNGDFGGSEVYHRDFFNCPLGGFYEVSGTWKIGGQSLSASDALWYQANRIGEEQAPSFNINEHLKSGRTLPVSMKFNDRAYIVGNFTPTELTPIVSYGCFAYQYGGWAAQTASIEGLKVVGRDGLDMTRVGRDSKQVGLLMTGGIAIRMQDSYFYNLQEGMIQNTMYKMYMVNVLFGNCGRGFFTIGSHSSSGTSLLADHCDIGFEIMSGATNWNINTEQCRRAAIVGTSNVNLIGGYKEQLDHTSLENEYQLTIGYPATHPFGQMQRLHSIKIEIPVIAGGSSRTMLVEQNVETVTIEGTFYGRNVYRDQRTKIKSEYMDWIYEPPPTHNP